MIAILKNDSIRTLLSNFSYLSILEIIGILFPLMTYPYLIRVIGAHLYGSIVFSQAILSYIIIVINFGFNVSATRRISENRNNVEEVKKIYSSVTYLKCLIFIGCLAIMILSSYFLDSDISLILLLLVGLCVQEIMFPTWLFQGIEQMKYITIVSLFSKIIFLAVIFFCVHSADDYYIIPIAYSLGGIFTSLLSVILLRNKKITFVTVSYVRLINDFQESIPFFTSRLSAVIMEKSNVLLIGVYFDYNMVAIYDLCTKVISIFKIPFTLVAQVLYPHVAKNRNMRIVQLSFKYVVISGCFIALLLLLFSPLIVSILGGVELSGTSASSILAIMAWYLPMVGASYILGASTLVINGLVREYNISVIYSLFIYVAITLVLVFAGIVNLYTMTFSLIIPELTVALYRYYVTCRNKLFL